MTMRHLLSFRIPMYASTLALVAAACGGEPASEPSEAPAAETPAFEAVPQPERRVEIVEPAEGAVVESGPLLVRLEAHGFMVVPAGDTTPNSGHHHLFLDRDVTSATDPIPVEEGFIIHMGTGVSEFTFDSIAPGEHRLIAVVGDALHVPVDPPLRDTVLITVQ